MLRLTSVLFKTVLVVVLGPVYLLGVGEAMRNSHDLLSIRFSRLLPFLEEIEILYRLDMAHLMSLLFLAGTALSSYMLLKTQLLLRRAATPNVNEAKNELFFKFVGGGMLGADGTLFLLGLFDSLDQFGQLLGCLALAVGWVCILALAAWVSVHLANLQNERGKS